MDEPTQGAFKPPYLSFQTFWSSLDVMLSRPLPRKLDRSMMQGKSGSDQAALMAALKAFDLIDENQVVTGLNDLADSDKTARARWLAEIIRKHYPAQMAVSDENGTEQQLRESFRDAFSMTSADTIRKSMTFFLHAARAASIDLSANFPAGRSGSGAPGTSKPRRTAKKKVSSSDSGKAHEEASVLKIDGDTYTLELQSGPVVTMIVKMNVMEASVTDRNFIFRLVDALRGYGKTAKASGSTRPAAKRESRQEPQEEPEHVEPERAEAAS